MFRLQKEWQKKAGMAAAVLFTLAAGLLLFDVQPVRLRRHAVFLVLRSVITTIQEGEMGFG